MAWMPGVDTSRKANDGNSQLRCNPDVVCIHTIVGYAPALAATFSTRADGYTWQHRDTTRQSAANLNGNDHIISIENEDHGKAFGVWNTNDGHAVPAFTSQQIEAIAKICAWAYKTHGIPLVLAKDSKPGSKGIAYHRQGIDSPNNFAGYQFRGRVSGGEVWSNARGKVCPGDRRIAQIPEIIKRARQIAGLEGGEQDLTPDESRMLKELHALYRKGNATPGVPQPAGELTLVIVEMLNRSRRLEATVDGLVTAVSKGSGLTIDAVREAVADALREAVVNVDVNVNSPQLPQ